MDDVKSHPISMLLAFAVFLEAMAAFVAFNPGGSLAATAGEPTGIVRALSLLGVTLAATVLLRLILPGPKPPSLFYRSGGPSLTRVLYYGFAAAVLLTFYRAAWVIGLHYAGTELVGTVPVDRFNAGPSAVLARVVVSLAGAYLFYGYVRVLVGRTLGERAGLAAAAVLAAVATIWPPVGAPFWMGSHEPILVFLLWRLPEAVALAYLAHRTRTVLAPVAAVFLIEWFAAIGTGIFALFGKWPFLFGCLITILVTAEILVAERRAVGRGVGGFFALLAARSEDASLLDAFLLAAALAGGAVLVRAADLIDNYLIIAVALAGVLLAGAVVLWFLYKFYLPRRRGRAIPPVIDAGGS
jgi:hypothetical protein